MLATLLLCALPLGLGAWIHHDLRQYAAFKRETTSIGRRRFYLRWTWQGFAALTGAALVVLAVLGRLGDVLGVPPEFAALVPTRDVDMPQEDDGEAYLGFVIGAGFGVVVFVALQVLRFRRTRAVLLGDVEPLIPRDALEQLASLPLCLNAGFSEELFFRLALPLLVTTVTGSAAAGLVVGCVTFGLAHLYQGYKGVLGTTAMGAMFTWLYLDSGSLLLPMIIHAAIDVIALVVRPTLVRWLSRGRRS
jgi:membrane protease YdiL (CAAX protease family)